MHEIVYGSENITGFLFPQYNVGIDIILIVTKGCIWMEKLGFE